MPHTSESPSPFQLLLTPARAALSTDRPTRLQLLVRVQAPDLPPGTLPRDPLHLALVLDRSGSMSGLPLEEAKRCAGHIVDQLGDDDRATLVAFDDEIEVLAALTAGRDKHALRVALDGIHPGGSTDLHGGWRAGAHELAASLRAEGVHRVILLSDGCANAGLTDLETIAGQCRDLARRGVSTSTYGLGRGFNEELMVAMAKAGRGNAYYGQTAADLAEPFATEFALLTQLCARGLVLKVNAPEAVGVRLRNDYEPLADGARAWKLPDLAYAAEAWAVIELDLPAMQAGLGATATLPVTISIEAAQRDSSPLFLMAALPPLAVVSAEALRDMPTDELVSRRIAELDAADLLSQVREAVAQGEWELAERLITQARERFHGVEWAQAVLEAMRRLLAQRDASMSRKEALYARNAMSGRLASKRESAAFSVSDEAASPAFLRRKRMQGEGKRPPDDAA